ncbi:MAG TPA: hypothetical protein PLZ99_01210 [Parcubacteria group bacterium]|jgi:hypothetical protein|nr:hypothetical protein [Parcubacteria group bacterium]
MENPENNNIANSSNNTDIKSFFEGGSDFIFICKKTEKLASAVYLITNLLSDNEPMKWTLRKKVSELLSFTITYKDIRQSELPNFFHNIKTRVSEIVSLLEVSLLAGLISKMNFTVIKEEFGRLLELFNHTSKTDYSNEILPKEFFGSTQNYTPQNTFIRETSSFKDSSIVKDNGGFKSNNRQGIILGLLKKKKDLTIKDISLVIKDVSEKTIQRELISLIEAGIILKTGERRWSRYSIKN